MLQIYIIIKLNMNGICKPVFLKGKLPLIKEPAGITYFAGNVIVAATSKDASSLLGEKALTIEEILNGLHEEGYDNLTEKDILSFSEKYSIIHYEFFLTLIRKTFEIIKKKSPEITIENYFDAIGKEAMNITRHQALAILGEKFSLLGARIEGTNFLQKLEMNLNGFISLIRGQMTKNPRFVYKNLGFYTAMSNCVKVVVHESKEDIANNQIGIEYIVQRPLDFFNDINIWYSKVTLKWIPKGCGCSRFSLVEFSKKNGNPFFTIRYFPEKVPIKKTLELYTKTVNTYDHMLLDKMEKEVEINHKEHIIDEYSSELMSLNAQLSDFLSETPKNERAKRLQSVMRSILHDWSKHIRNIEFFAAKIENNLKKAKETHSGDFLDDYIKWAGYITFSTQNLSNSVAGIRNYNKLLNEFQDLDVTKLISTIFEVEKYKISNYNNQLKFSPEIKNVSIRVNSYQIHNMINNLLDNAVRHGDITNPDFNIILDISIEKKEIDYLKIVIENNALITKKEYDELIVAIKEGRNFSTIQNCEGHGIRDIISVINNHKGKYEIQHSGGKFLFIIYLPVIGTNV